MMAPDVTRRLRRRSRRSCRTKCVESWLKRRAGFDRGVREILRDSVTGDMTMGAMQQPVLSEIGAAG
jgi:hypothetical protein